MSNRRKPQRRTVIEKVRVNLAAEERIRHSERNGSGLSGRAAFFGLRPSQPSRKI